MEDPKDPADILKELHSIVQEMAAVTESRNMLPFLRHLIELSPHISHWLVEGHDNEQLERRLVLMWQFVQSSVEARLNVVKTEDFIRAMESRN